MEIITIYKYKNNDGTTTISPENKGNHFAATKRIVAGDMKDIIKNNDYSTRCKCIDTDDTEGWSEVDITEEEREAIEAYKRREKYVLYK